jgi:hypothetical protein
MAESITAMEHNALADHTQPIEAAQAGGRGAESADRNELVFGGESRNMAMGIAMLAAGAGAFVLGLTHTFFAEAMAITFVCWGLLFLYNDLLLSTRRFTVADDGLKIDVPMRPWSRSRLWEWKDINRLDIVTYRRDVDPENSTIQVHHQYPGEISLDREDRNYDPTLARLIIERAGLKPDKSNTGVDLGNLPTGKDATYTWKK